MIIGKIVIVNDKMQNDYAYLLTEPEGKNFHPDFKPELTPAQMLALGVFGGKYWRDGRKELPKSWFKQAKLLPDDQNTSDEKINFFGVKASQSLRIWRDKGWIHPDDPRGWFQWYARYYLGRRSVDDERQIKRWRAMKRHINQIKNNCLPHDLTCRRKQRQALLHWAYDSRRI